MVGVGVEGVAISAEVRKKYVGYEMDPGERPSA